MVDFNRYIKGGDRYRDLLAPKPAPPAVPPIVIGVTGHRPHKLYSPGSVALHSPNGDGYNAYNPLRVRIRQELQSASQMLMDRAAALGKRSDRYADATHCASYLQQVTWRACTPWTPDNLPTTPVALSGMALGVDTDAVKVWIEMAGITTPFPIQAAAVPDALAGRDILGRDRRHVGVFPGVRADFHAGVGDPLGPGRVGRHLVADHEERGLRVGVLVGALVAALANSTERLYLSWTISAGPLRSAMVKLSVSWIQAAAPPRGPA